MDVEACLETQQQLIDAMKQLLVNFKKDGADRKTSENIKRRIDTLDRYWCEFQNNHSKLCQTLDSNHDYLTGNYYEDTQKFYQETRDYFQKYILIKPATPMTIQKPREQPEAKAGPSTPASGANKFGSTQLQEQQLSQGTNSKLDEMMKKQFSNFKALSRTISQINIDKINDKWEFEDILKTLQNRWQTIDKLHWEIDSELDGSDLRYENVFTEQEESYNAIKRSINSKLWSVSHRDKITPQLDIPIYTGNYQQWVSFKDLFCEAVHNNPSLSNAQKMQFLKSKLRGEPERLIQHLQISSENYTTCWEIISHRYNNKKLIFTSYMNTIMNIPNIIQPTSSHIKRIHDVTMECLNAISNMGVDIRTWDPIIVHILSQKLDAETHKEYMSSLKQPRELPIIAEFLEFLEHKFTTMESARRKQEGMTQKTSSTNGPTQGRHYQEKPNYNKQYHSTNKTVTQSNIFSSNTKLKCPSCESTDHGIYYCKTFQEMNPQQRKQVVSRNNLCINCLKRHHGICALNKRCRECNECHNTLLHDAYSKFNHPKPNVTMKSAATESSQRKSSSHVSGQREAPEILLATAVIKVEGIDGIFKNMRALIDPGSQISIITENAAQQLGLPRQQCSGIITGVGTKDTTCKGKLNIHCSSTTENYKFRTEVFIMKKLTRDLPNCTFTKPELSYLDNLQLADPEFHISRPIDILLGADVYSHILLEGIRKVDNDRPVAQQTLLGWILYGKIQTLQCNIVLNKIEDIQRFWQIEDLPDHQPNLSSEDQECMDIYTTTTTRLKDGRYQVRLPFKNNINEMGDSKRKATAQFLQLEKKFYNNTQIASKYKSFMDEYQELGHMKLASDKSTQEYFLPHHCIIRDSTTTSLRVVFNASQATTNGKSLNDYMHKGPNLQNDLFELILKWRQYPIALTADIEKMFRQIMVHPEDLKYQKILWRDSPRDVLREYELCTVTYGTKAAPFLAMMTLRQLAADERDTHQEAAHVIETSFYMDDLIHGAHSIESALQLKQDLKQLLLRGGFNLRKWTSNCKELLQDDQVLEQQENYDFKQSTSTSTKALGLRWNPEQDVFIFHTTIENIEDNTSNSKRKLLSDISKLFDPLGWLTPISTKLKLLFQKIWETNIGWDDKIPEEINSEWIKIKQDLKNINEITIPRWLGTTTDLDIELHGFSDASQKAYACVIYYKKRNNQKSTINLVVSKSKLVPRNKDISLPKLELCGALLLARLMQKVIQCLSNYNIKIYGYVDSTAVLGWLQGNPDRWKTFVSNRVNKITEVMPSNCWKYVKSADNPADCASRGFTVTQLLQHNLWWHGPSWLSENNTDTQEITRYETNQEAKEIKQVNVTVQKDNSIIKNILNKYSNLSRAIRVLAWVRRFIIRENNIPKRESYLTLTELKEAKTMFIKEIQAEEFHEEIKNLTSNKKISSKSKIIHLSPFLDKQGILRVGGRLQHANISQEMKNPIILPYGGQLTELIIEEAHKLTFHGGPRVTLALLRQKYWLISGNRAVKKITRRCTVCNKHNPRKQEQIMGDLPQSRVNQSRPFQHTGVDFTGHFFIKANKGRGIKTTKAYVAVFVCMATKAVHLELVSDLTTSAFIAALRRMAARRGKPSHMYSDNGRNFVGASRVLQEEYQEIIQVFNEEFKKEITDMEITWHFNAPSWPSAGGLFEAAVKSFKYHFKRVVGEQKLTFEEFYTLLTQIEACLNSRPLCALSEDPDNLDFLTPAHFLTGGPLLTIVETERDMRTRWQLTQKIYQDIWKRWRSEYLTQLSSRSKWTQPSENINLNDVVIIQDDNLPPGKWLMGRVVELHPGQDGYVRVVTLKTKSGLIKRPVTKVARLIKQQENDNHEQQNEIKNTRKQEPKQTTNKTPTRKHTMSSILAACLLFMTLMTGAESKVNITKFRENQGLYFDKISNMQLIKDEWKLIVYYNMEPYEQGITALNTYLENLDKTCSSLHDQALCHAVLLQLRHGRDELEYYDQLLLSRQITTQPTQRRKRRGLINAIGSIASDLFGVLDERFAEQYKRDISLLQNNQKHMIQLWKNQTSIVEAENNLLKRTEDIINQQHKTLNQHINSLEKAINQLKGATEGNMILNNFAIGAIIASNMLASLKNLQNNLLDTITDIHQNRFNLHLMTPEQLMEELSTVSSQLPKDVTLPIENVHSDLRKIYNLLKIRARMLEDYLIFEIRIPLISRDSYELLKVIPIPKIQDEKSISIVPVSEYVSINMKKDTYIPMSESDVNACLVQFDMHFCHSWKPEYQLNEDKNLCEIEHSECKTQVNPCKNTWQESYATNTYIYFCCKQCNVRVMCGDQVTAHQLQAEGLVTVGHGCIIKTDKLSIFPHKTHSSEFKIWPNLYIPKMAPINNIINITIPHLTIENKSEELKQEAEKIEEKIKIAKAKGEEVLIEADNLSLHDIHHYVMIYVVVSIAGIIGVIMIIRRLRCKWHIPPSVAEPSIMMNELTSPPPVVQAAAAPRSSRTARQVDEYAVLERQVDRSTSPAPKRIIIPRSQADLHQ